MQPWDHFIFCSNRDLLALNWLARVNKDKGFCLFSSPELYKNCLKITLGISELV